MKTSMKKIIHERSIHTNAYQWFDDITNHESGMSVLDFGCSSGNLLYFSDGIIKERDYTGIDVVDIAIDSAIKEFPNAEWILSPQYNSCYNISDPVQFDYTTLTDRKDFDVVWAYAVFSHTSFNDLKNALLWFNTFDYKTIAVSILDIDCKYVKQYFIDRRIKYYGSCTDDFMSISSDNNIAYFVNNDIIVYDDLDYQVDSECFLTFYNIDWLISELTMLGLNISIERRLDGHIPFIVMKK
jgi:hypothetical protein